MKKNLLFLTALIFLTGTYGAQEEKGTVKKGDNHVSFYYGYSVLAGLYESTRSFNPIDLNVKTLGPVGIVYEHMITKRIGLGGELGYTKFTLNYTDTYFLIDSDVPFQATLTIEIIRAMFRANFHFLNFKRLNAYGLISAGYKGSTYSYSSNYPDDPGITLRNLLPVGFKPGVGFRYFIIENAALHIELSLGSPMIGGGIGFKF